MKNKKKISILQMMLTIIFVVCLLVSNIITSKQMVLPFNIIMTCAVIIFPITYILSDVFSEVYGYKWSRLTCYLGFGANLFLAIISMITIKTPPAPWVDNNAFVTVLGNTPRILVASLAAFVLGDLVNDLVFKKMKSAHKDNHKKFGLRAIISSFCGEIIDSGVFIPLAFIGQMPLNAMIKMGVIQVLLKISYEIIILPITTLIMKKVSKYEA